MGDSYLPPEQVASIPLIVKRDYPLTLQFCQRLALMCDLLDDLSKGDDFWSAVDNTIWLIRQKAEDLTEVAHTMQSYYDDDIANYGQPAAAADIPLHDLTKPEVAATFEPYILEINAKALKQAPVATSSCIDEHEELKRKRSESED
ncbi:hypothetical protein C8J56DRAFT_1058292 [Mycena floridula]|nr:hypothetical protein C8J56DRAFT_1058292 [Mycena floridula]